MANKPIPMHHPKSGGKTEALTEAQARVFEQSGWKRDPGKKAGK